MSTPTVEFDVGGTVYKVSKSLLEQHPDTMLTRMASETWNKRDKDGSIKQSKPLFIERNGKRFQFVLDYMRDGKVSLPIYQEVTKESMLQELEYYGFVDIDSGAIEGSLQGEDMGKFAVSVNETFQSALKIQESALEIEKIKFFSMMLARKCNGIWQNNPVIFRLTKSLIKDTEKNFEGIQVDPKIYYHDQESRLVLNEYLGQYFGLQLTGKGGMFNSCGQISLK